MIQQQRKILRESLNRTKSTTERSTTTTITTSTTFMTEPTTEQQTTTTPTTTLKTITKLPTSSIRPQRRNGLNVPKARKLAGGYNRIVPSQSSSSVDEQENKNNDDQFDLNLARRALLEAQLSQQKRQRLQQNEGINNKQPKPWQPTLRMLRHRHRQQLLEEQKINNNNNNNSIILQPIHNNKQKQQLLNRQLFGEENNAIDWRNRQFGIRNRQQQNELIKDQLGKELLQLEGGDDINEKGRQALQLERRFRLVPNKVVFRPRLKIRRPQNNENVNDQRPNIQLPENSAFGTEQKRGNYLPIALPSLSAFGEEPSEQPIPIPPSAGEPPPSQVVTQTIIKTTTTDTTTTTTTSQQPPPAPAMEIGSMGEQPPMKLEGGPPPTITTTLETTSQPSQKIEENGESHGEDSGIIGNSGLVGSDGAGPLPPGFSEAGAGFIGLSNGAEDNGLSFGSGPEVGTFPPCLKESFGLNGFVTELETTLSNTESPTTTTTTTLTTTTISELQTTTEVATTTIPTTTTPTPAPPSPQPSPSPPEEVFVIPENSGLRPVAPPKEFFGAGGFGSSSVNRGGGGFGSGFIGGSNGNSRGWEPPPPGAQVEPPLKPEDFYTGDSALIPNKKGPDGDGYGPSASLPGSAPSPPTPPPIAISGASGGIPMLPPFRPIPNAIGIPPVAGMGIVAPPQEAVPENEATTVKPSALLNIINKADEGFNQVITHFEQGTPLEAAAIDIMEVALGSQKLDSQAKLLSHVDRAFGLDNLQRLQRWANTGGALDLIKEQFAKIAKNYKPPQETANLFTVPPQLEYLFQNPSSGRRK